MHLHFFTHQGARQGDVILAANAVLLNFQSLLALGLDGFANAAEAMVGSAIGKRDKNSLRQSITITSIWALLIAVCFTLFFLIFGKILIFTITNLPDVRNSALVFLPWLIVSPLISVWCFQLDGIFIGATRGREMRNMMIVSTFFIYLPTYYLFGGLGNHGLWLALMVFFLWQGSKSCLCMVCHRKSRADLFIIILMAEERTFIPLNIAVLVVSDSRTDKTDKSGKLLVERLEKAGHKLYEKQIVPDELVDIQDALNKWIANNEVNVALTTGGTGVTGRDGTPEAAKTSF